ncbi:Ctr copper transporter [Cytidiella melzeri]|nr:Ctr copper transporter [Cytidiella melzeri]
MDVVMTPWLHFTGGDPFYFKSLTPSSHGAIAAACIVLVVISIFDRWLFAMKNVLDVHWARSAIALRSSAKAEPAPNPPATPEKEAEATTTQSRHLLRKGRASASLPFVASHDLPRGAIFAFQALLTYVLMLAVMTFQAAYIISIVVGLGIGEVLFGRMATAGVHLGLH